MSSRDFISAFARPSAIACVLLSASGLAPAQSTTQTDVERLDIEEVVVTALKRSSKLQETPLSMLAVSGETLRDKGVDNVSDLLRSTPGLTIVDQGASQRRLVIRGVQSAGEAQTGLYYDETPVSGGSPSTTNDPGQRMPEMRLFDVERIEVLRGPQGTLYGSGSTWPRSASTGRTCRSPAAPPMAPSTSSATRAKRRSTASSSKR